MEEEKQLQATSDWRAKMIFFFFKSPSLQHDFKCMAITRLKKKSIPCRSLNCYIKCASLQLLIFWFDFPWVGMWVMRLEIKKRKKRKHKKRSKKRETDSHNSFYLCHSLLKNYLKLQLLTSFQQKSPHSVSRIQQQKCCVSLITAFTAEPRSMWALPVR